MHIVVIGLGQVGRHLLEVLEREGHDVVAIDKDPDAIRYAEDHFDVMTLHGFGGTRESLDRAGAAKSDLVVAVTDNDELNLVAALTAQRLGAKRVIARAQSAAWATRDEAVQYGLLGVDVVVNPRVLVAQELAKIARSHGALDVINLANERIELVQVVLGERTRMLNKPLAKLQLPRQTLVAAVVRSGQLFVPGGADVLLDVMEAQDLFTSRKAADRVCIIGGGVVGQSLATFLAGRCAKVMLIESSRERAETLGMELEDVVVVHGDGTDMQLMQQEEVGTYDLVAAVTQHDEINLMAALLARQVGAGRVASLVQRGDYMPIYRQLGIDIVLSPRVVASDHIMRYCRESELQSLTQLENGQAEVLEFRARKGARAIGVPLRRMKIPRGALLAAIVHNDQVVIPGGDDVVQSGDTVIVLTTTSVRASVERLFRPRIL
ncbi:MAG: Trk system potassium transporter TrkA [Myxococcota bacterium]